MRHICQQCDKSFERRGSKYKYCSPECYHTSRLVARGSRKCPTCYKEFKLTEKTRNNKFCSRKCYWSTVGERKLHTGHTHTEEVKSRISKKKGGTGIPYELTEYGAGFDDYIKEQIRFRDNYKCQECGCSQLESGRQLDCHHIDYNKCHNIFVNLISLCRSCHGKTNHNRKHWERHLKLKMEKKYEASNFGINPFAISCN